MFVLAVLGLGWVPVAQSRSAGILLVVFVFPLELLAAVLAALARDTLATTVLGLFAGSWVALGVNFIVGTPGSTVRVDGFFLLFFAAVVVSLAIVATTGKPLITLLLALSSTRAALDGAHQLGAGTGVLRLAGVAALALAAVALYSGFAFALEDARGGRALLPLFRRGKARSTLDSGLDAQAAEAVNEPGVRQQL